MLVSPSNGRYKVCIFIKIFSARWLYWRAQETYKYETEENDLCQINGDTGYVIGDKKVI